MNYSEYLISVAKAMEYDNLKTENCKLYQRIAELEKENEKLIRVNYGLKNTISNLKEKLWKRNEFFKGEVR